MKYLLLLAVLFASCKNVPVDVQTGYKDDKGQTRIGTKGAYYIYTEIVDSCEYIVCEDVSNEGGVSIIHKANCKNHK